MFYIDILFGSSTSIFPVVMFSSCLYFTLTYFKHLKRDEERLIKQSKLFAILTLFLALAIPAIYDMYITFLVMR